MPPTDLEATLTAVADRVAAQVAGYADRVAVDRAPQGTTAWRLEDGPYAVVTQTGPTIPAYAGDGRTLIETSRISVAVWVADDGQRADLIVDTVAALDGWPLPGAGIAGRVFGVYRVPQPETDLLRTEIEVRYAHAR